MNAPLDSCDVLVRIASPAELDDPARIAAYEALLSPEERERLALRRRPEDRLAGLVARALVRTTLSAVAPLPPEAWRFTTSAEGRPELAPGSSPLPLRFNLAHTDGLVAVAVALGRDVGVDVEAHDRPTPVLEIAGRQFDAREFGVLATLPENERPTAFFRLWTLKEAYLKARGLGLPGGLDQVVFDLEEGNSPRCTLGASLADDATAWRFALARPTERHILAVAARRGDDPPLRITLQRAVPLEDDAPPPVVLGESP